MNPLKALYLNLTYKRRLKKCWFAPLELPDGMITPEKISHGLWSKNKLRTFEPRLDFFRHRDAEGTWHEQSFRDHVTSDHLLREILWQTNPHPQQ